MTLKEIIERVKEVFPDTPPGYIIKEVNRIQNALLPDRGTVAFATSFTDTSKVTISFAADLNNAVAVNRIYALNGEGNYVNDLVSFEILDNTLTIRDYDGSAITSWPSGVTTIKVFGRRKPTALTPASALTIIPELDEKFHGLFEAEILENLNAKNKDYNGARYWHEVAKDLKRDFKRFINKAGDDTGVYIQPIPLDIQ